MSDFRFNSKGTPGRTPIRSRSHFNMPYGIHQSPHPNQSGTPRHLQESNSYGSEDSQYLYGTNINTRNVLQSLENFVMNFEELIPSENGEPQS